MLGIGVIKGIEQGTSQGLDHGRSHVVHRALEGDTELDELELCDETLLLERGMKIPVSEPSNTKAKSTGTIWLIESIPTA